MKTKLFYQIEQKQAILDIAKFNLDQTNKELIPLKQKWFKKYGVQYPNVKKR